MINISVNPRTNYTDLTTVYQIKHRPTTVEVITLAIIILTDNNAKTHQSTQAIIQTRTSTKHMGSVFYL